jgi:hypothetical protein
MTLIPRNKQLRGLLIGGAALSAIMAGPILVDATAQAQSLASCAAGGVCLTPTNPAGGFTTTVTDTAPGTTDTVTQTEPGTTDTVTQTEPGTTTTTTVTQTEPGTTVTQTEPGTTYTVTQTEPGTTTTTTVTQTVTVTAAPVTTTVTNTVTSPTTVTVTVTSTRSSYTGTNTNTYTGTTGTEGTEDPFVKPAYWRNEPTETTGTDACGAPGSQPTLSNGQVETCGPTSGREAVYATQPGLYNSIFNDSSSYYVSAGIFAPQYSFGRLAGCYYVPESAAVKPGDTVSTGGIIADAVAFGVTSQDVSNPVSVPRSDCNGIEPVIKAAHQGHVQNRR